MTNQTQVSVQANTFRPRDYGVFAGLDVDHHSKKAKRVLVFSFRLDRARRLHSTFESDEKVKETRSPRSVQ